MMSGVCLLLLLLVHGFLIEPNRLIARSYTLALPRWPAALNGFKIAAVGDIHAGAPFIDENKLEAMVRRLSAEKADLIVWLGDYVIQEVIGGHFMEPEKVAAILSKAKATHGQIAIIGNHDRWLNAARIENAFEAAGIPFLRWKAKTFPLKGVALHVFGFNDFEGSPNYWQSLRRTQREWRTLPADEPIVVLSHSPDVFDDLPARVVLTLAAHTHGGQVRLPFFGSPIVPSAYGQRFARGLIIEDGRHLFVNTGIGTSIIPVRFRVPPEISILTLVHAAAN